MIRNLYQFIFTITLSINIAYCSADYKRLCSTDGLSNDNVICITQDADGVMWFGTKDGINMYDGYEISVFKPDPGSGLNISMVRSMLLDDDGILWIGKRGSGIVWFDTKSKTFLPFEYDADFSIDNRRILDFAYNESTVWIAANVKGQLIYDRSTRKLILDTLSQPLAKTTSLLYDNGILWIGKNRNENELVRFNTETNEVTAIDFYKQGEAEMATYFWDIKKGADGKLILPAWAKGLILYDPESPIETPLYTYACEDEGVFTRIKSLEVIGNSILTASRNGLQQITHKKNGKCSIKTIAIDDKPTSTGFDNNLQKVFIDHSNNLWIGTATEGVKYVDYTKGKFQLYSAKNLFNTIGPNISFLYHIHDNEFYSGLALKRFNTDLNSVELVNQISDLQTDFRALAMEHFDINGKSMVLIGTWLKGIVFIDADKELSQVHTAFRTDYLGYYIVDFLQDTNDDIWFTTEQGVKVLRYSGNAQSTLRPELFEIITPKFADDIFYDSNVRCLHQDRKGNIWIGTLAGLGRISDYENIETDTLQCTYYSQNSTGKTFLAATGIERIYQAQSDTLWFGTVGGGLAMYTYTDDTIINFTKRDGFNGDNVFEIVQEKPGVLWMSSNGGISRFQLHAPKTQQFKNFTTEDGLQGFIFNKNAVYKSNEGEIFFGGTNGLNLFHPDSLPIDTIAPNVKITDITVYNHSYDDGKYPVHLEMLAKENEYWQMYLSPGDYAFEIRFSALSYSNPKKNQYAFYLEGYDEKWRIVSAKNRIAYYSNLPPGEYVFKIKASNSLGYWSDEYSKIAITVDEVFWKRPWFVLILFLVATLGYFIFHKIRVKILRNRQIELEQKVEERTAALASANEELVATNYDLHEKSEIILEQKEELEQTVSDLKKTQLKLIQAEKMASLGILTAGIAHEINNPLNFIKGGQVALEEYFKEYGSQNKRVTDLWLKSIGTGVDRTAAIVKGLNQFSRDNEQLDEECNIHSILDNSLLILKSLIEDKAELRKKYNAPHFIVKGNVGKMHQVFVNIITNAIHAIEANGEVIIETRNSDSFLIVSVSDNGAGIPAEALKHVTDPFYTTKDPGEGTGLGMSITYSIVKDHQGVLEIESEEGRGTNVVVKLPIIDGISQSTQFGLFQFY